MSVRLEIKISADLAELVARLQRFKVPSNLADRKVSFGIVS